VRISQPGAEAVFALQETAMLLGERICDRRARHEPASNEDRAEELAGALLLRECIYELALVKEACLDEHRAEATPASLRSHLSPSRDPRIALRRIEP
jgi:hypothetical protein